MLECNHIFTEAFRRYEFATNEYINDMACVTLETSSTENGSKDFIVVGTTIDRGEDLAAKGAVRLYKLSPPN
jgi:cleavage and polyadenylation specificity factor subunit 1